MNKLLIAVALPDKIADTARMREIGRRVVAGTKSVIEALVREGVLEPGEMLVAVEPTIVMAMPTRRAPDQPATAVAKEKP